MKDEYTSGATPLDPDEIDGLIPSHITTQRELNEWEEANILKAENWIFSTYKHGNFLTIDYIKLIHKKMFGQTWKWAGSFRNSEKPIGAEPSTITTKLKILLDDVSYHIINNTYSIDETAYRFHHRLVAIHPFPNGNGRHARTFTDLLLIQTGQPRFTWGRQKLGEEGPIRKQYIDTLKEADKHNYLPLAAFVRS